MPNLSHQFKSAVSCQVTVESKAKGDICKTYAACIVKFKIWYFVHHDFCINFDVGKRCIVTLLILITEFFGHPFKFLSRGKCLTPVRESG